MADTEYQVKSGTSGYTYAFTLDHDPTPDEIDDFVAQQDKVLRSRGQDAFRGTKTWSLNASWKPPKSFLALPETPPTSSPAAAADTVTLPSFHAAPTRTPLNRLRSASADLGLTDYSPPQVQGTKRQRRTQEALGNVAAQSKALAQGRSNTMQTAEEAASDIAPFKDVSDSEYAKAFEAQRVAGKDPTDTERYDVDLLNPWSKAYYAQHGKAADGWLGSVLHGADMVTQMIEMAPLFDLGGAALGELAAPLAARVGTGGLMGRIAAKIASSEGAEGITAANASKFMAGQGVGALALGGASAAGVPMPSDLARKAGAPDWLSAPIDLASFALLGEGAGGLMEKAAANGIAKKALRAEAARAAEAFTAKTAKPDAGTGYRPPLSERAGEWPIEAGYVPGGLMDRGKRGEIYLPPTAKIPEGMNTEGFDVTGPGAYDHMERLGDRGEWTPDDAVHVYEVPKFKRTGGYEGVRGKTLHSVQQHSLEQSIAAHESAIEKLRPYVKKSESPVWTKDEAVVKGPKLGDAGTYVGQHPWVDAKVLHVNEDGRLWLELTNGKKVGPVTPDKFSVQGKLFEDEPDAMGAELELQSPKWNKQESSEGQNALFSTGRSLEAMPAHQPPAFLPAEPNAEPTAPKSIKFEIGPEFTPQPRTGKMGKKGALGFYEPSTSRIAIRFEGDLPTTAHEIAHALDDKFDLVGRWKGPRQRSPFDDELLKPDLQRTARKSMPLWQRRAEGVAELVRSYVLDPQAAESMAPRFVEHMRDRLPEEVMARLDTFGQDVRSWAAQPSAQKAAGQIRMEGPAKPSIGEKIADLVTKPDRSLPFSTRSVDRLRQLFTDEVAPFESAVTETLRRTGRSRQYLDVQGGDLSPSSDPIVLARALPYLKNKIDSIFKDGMISSTGERVTPPLAHVLEPLDASSFKSLESDTRDMFAMMASERVLEKSVQIMGEASVKAENIRQEAASRATLTPNISKEVRAAWIEKANKKAAQIELDAQLRVERLAGWGGGIYSDRQVAMSALTELASNPDRYAALQEGARRYREFADAALQYAVDKGLIAAKAAKAMRDRNEFYVDMGRVLDDELGLGVRTGGARVGAGKNPVKRWQGSTRQIDSPLVGMMADVEALVRESDKNEVLRKWRDLLTTNSKREMYGDQPLDLTSIGHRVKAGDKGAVKVLVNGKPEHWVFEKGVKDAITSLGSVHDPNFVEAMARIPGALLRTSVTRTPGYAVRNFIRDIQHRLKSSRTSEGAIKEIGRTFGSLRPTGTEKANYKLYGAGIGRGHYLEGPTDWYGVQREVMNEIAGDKKHSVLLLPHRGAELWENMINASERAGRIAEVRSALEKARAAGMDEYNAQLYAAGQSRELLDFARGGKVIKFINRYVPFVNARVQGLARWGTAIGENPGRAAAAWVKFAVMPTVAVYLWNRTQGEDTLREYRDLPPYQRDLFWNMKIGPDMWLRIPKDYESGVLAASVERTIGAALGDQNSFDGHAGQILRTLLPMDEAEMMGPMRGIFETMGNYDFFRQKSIVPPYEDQLDLDLRHSERGSRLGQALQAVLQVDSRKIDHFIQNEFADFGRLATMASDVGRSDRPSLTSAKAANLATGLTVGSPVTASNNVQWVMQTATGRGLTAAPELKRLRKLLDGYYDSKSDVERDHRGQEVRMYAAQVRKEWDMHHEQGPNETALRQMLRSLQAEHSDEPLTREIESAMSQLTQARNAAIEHPDRLDIRKVKERIESASGVMLQRAKALRDRNLSPAGR